MSKRVVVTGGSSGIGLAIVRALHAAGHRVEAIGRRPAPEVAEAGDLAAGVGYHALDLTDLELAATRLGEIADAGDGLDVLINNAGVMRYENVEDADSESILAQLHTNLAAPIRLSAAAVAWMKLHARPGLIINIASVAASKATPRLATYSASKAGLVQFTRSLAAECAGDGIRAVAVTPGAVHTNLTHRVMFAMIEKAVPLGSLQQPEEVASLVGWLVSEDAVNVTGSVFALDGGMSF